MMSEKRNTFKLENLERENNFRVPEGYFENFKERLHEKINFQENTSYKKSFTRSILQYQTAIAASFIGILIVSFFGLKTLFNHRALDSEVSRSGIAAIPNINLDEIDESMLYDLYSETESSASSNEEAQNSDALIDYLLLEDTDIEILMLEL